MHEHLPDFSPRFSSVRPAFSSGGAHLSGVFSSEFLPENEHPKAFLLAPILKLSFTDYFVIVSLLCLRRSYKSHRKLLRNAAVFVSIRNVTSGNFFTLTNTFQCHIYMICLPSFFILVKVPLEVLNEDSPTTQTFLLFSVCFQSSAFWEHFHFCFSVSFSMYSVLCFSWTLTLVTSTVLFYFYRLGCFFPLHRFLICICADFFCIFIAAANLFFFFSFFFQRRFYSSIWPLPLLHGLQVLLITSCLQNLTFLQSFLPPAIICSDFYVNFIILSLFSVFDFLQVSLYLAF